MQLECYYCHIDLYRHGGHQNRRKQSQGGGKDFQPRSYQYRFCPSADTSQRGYGSVLSPLPTHTFSLSMDIWKSSDATRQDESLLFSKKHYCQRLTACVQDVFEGMSISNYYSIKCLVLVCNKNDCPCSQ